MAQDCQYVQIEIPRFAMATTMAESGHVPSDAVPPSGASMVQDISPSAVRMKRTTSQDIREGTEDLKEAAEQSLTVILDLSLAGVVRWVSPSWTDVVGTPPESIQGKPIADLVLDNQTAFADAVENLKKDDSRSQFIRFDVEMGPQSKLLPPPPDQAIAEEVDGVERQDQAMDADAKRLVLEGQGIMVYDRSSGGESHVRSRLSKSHMGNVTDLV